MLEIIGFDVLLYLNLFLMSFISKLIQFYVIFKSVFLVLLSGSILILYCCILLFKSQNFSCSYIVLNTVE